VSTPGRPLATEPLAIAVCALTFRRPVGLEELLDGLAAIDPPENSTIDVVIVDNDPEASARERIDARRGSMPWPLHYDVEPRRGIPFGRNRAVTMAADADVVVFLDDDEVPDRNWLDELVRVLRSTGADVVTGPIRPRFDEPPPRWVVDGRFFERPRFRTGEEIGYARTSNVLVTAPVFPADTAPFNEEMGLNGGDDTHFFMRARMNGHRIVWADDAWVTEAVPPSRVRVRWLLQREYRRGNTLSMCLLDLDDTPWRRFRRAVHGLLRIGEGVVLLVPAVVRGRAQQVRALQHITFGSGLLTGLFGVKYLEYRNIHGR
jgi:GT2 family glycosyltransferase